MTHTMYDAFDTEASTAYVKDHFHYNDPDDVKLNKCSASKDPAEICKVNFQTHENT